MMMQLMREQWVVKSVHYESESCKAGNRALQCNRHMGVGVVFPAMGLIGGLAMQPNRKQSCSMCES